MRETQILDLADYADRRNSETGRVVIVPDGEQRKPLEFPTRRAEVRLGLSDLYAGWEGIYHEVVIPNHEALYAEDAMSIDGQAVSDLVRLYETGTYISETAREIDRTKLQIQLYRARAQYIKINIGPTRRQAAYEDLARYTWGVGREDALPKLRETVNEELEALVGKKRAGNVRKGLQLLDTIYEAEKNWGLVEPSKAPVLPFRRQLSLVPRG